MDKIRSRAPGRINIIGEHTDYNNGFVFPAAIEQFTESEMQLNGSDNLCRIESTTLSASLVCDLDNLNVTESTWENYLIGVLGVLTQRGHKLRGFDCKISSTIPIGGGVSSSAALTCSFIYALNALFKLGLDKIEMAKICQEADHKYVGIKSGIMDQFTSMMGKADHAIKLDCRSMGYTYHRIELSDYRYYLINSNVHHELASSEYNKRQIECEEAVNAAQAKYKSIESLRDFDLDILLSIKNDISNIAFNRAKHVVEENDRVNKSIDALNRNDLESLGKYMYASHYSLSQLYEVSCTELDYIVDLCKAEPTVLGARMMGGGFGGCVLVLIKSSDIDGFYKHLMKEYFNYFQIEPTLLEVRIGEGAQLVE